MLIRSYFASKAKQIPTPECRSLDVGRATTVYAQQTGCLRVFGGRAWVTVARQRGGEESLDHVLVGGASLWVPKGATLVLEAWPLSSNPTPLCFGWQHLPAPRPSSMALRAWRFLRPSQRAMV